MNAHDLARATAEHHAVLTTDWVRTVRLRVGDSTALLTQTVAGVTPLIDDGRDAEFEVRVDAATAEAIAQGSSEAALCAWFWPVTWWTLRRRRARDWVLQMGVEVENVLHFTLPSGAFTALHINAEWVWVAGHHAIASRHFTLDPQAMRQWLDAAVRATTAGNDRYWEWFMPWYNAFRDEHSLVTLNSDRQQRLLAEFRRYDHSDEPEEAWPGWEDW